MKYISLLHSQYELPQSCCSCSYLKKTWYSCLYFSFSFLYLLQAKEQAAAEKQLTTHVPREVNAGNAKQLNAAPIFYNKEKKSSMNDKL